MSRRSADADREPGRERERDNYIASASYELEPTREYEPGELRGSDWEVERDPRVGPSAGTTGRGRISPRNSERERDRNELTIALEGFSRTMHATLLSTSAQALAAQHFRRMESFSIPSTGIPSPSLAEAQNRLRAAEVDLGERMRDLYGTFDELMRRTLISRGTYRTESTGGTDTERGMQKEGDVARELSKVELDAVRDRMRTLERRLDEAYPISRKGKEKEPTDEENGVEHKRSRARLLLEDMSSRLAVVEGLKEDLDTRCNDLEDLVNSRIQDELEIDRIGNKRWKVFEDLRDPDGVIRGLKRKREGEDVPPLPSQDLHPPLDDKPISHTNTDTNMNGPVATLQQQVPATTNDRSEIAQLKAQVYSLKTMVNSSLIINNSRQYDPNSALQEQVEALQTELKQVKDELKSLMDKASADAKTLDDLKLHCETFVRTQILHTVAKLAKNPPQNGSGSSSRVSPSGGIPSGLPSTTPGVLSHHLTRQEQQQQQSQPHQGGQSRPTQGHQNPTSFSQVVPQAYSGTLAEPPNPKTIGQVRSSSQPATQPQLKAQVQSRYQPPPTQNSESTTTPTGAPIALASKQVPRPASAQALHSSIQPQRSATPNQQQQLSQSDKPITSQTIRPPSPGQVSSVSRSIQASQNQTGTSSNLLAEWVEQRIKQPQLHQPDRQQLQVSQRPPRQYPHVPLQLHPAQGLPTPPQSSNPLSSFMQGHQRLHQSAPDGNGNDIGTRFPGIGTPANHGMEGSGSLVQQMNNAMHQQLGQGQDNNDGEGPYNGS